ncbi:MAG: hypothetical protein HYZ42_02675 [Bacteroidetes bacterium]|nr:hypothetical protein [Bacteroidota bacterium]
MFTKYSRVFIVILLFAFTQSANSQTDSQNYFLKIHSIGFDYQLQINHLDVSPQLWIMKKDKIETAVDLHALYYYHNSDRVKKMAYGAGLTLRYNFTQNFYSQLSYQNLNIPIRQTLDMSFGRAWKADFLLGLGYKQSITNKCTAQLTALYNLNYKAYSPYESNIIVKAGAFWSIK